ncbi:hypothetical protein RQP46_001892 [Phenoliferia psychrophenolica]
MGLFGSSSSTSPADLQPFNPPLGVLPGPHFCVPQPTTLVMKEAAFSFSGDDFSIIDSNKVEVLRCKGKTFGFGDKKAFTDTQGRPLFKLRTKLLAIHKTFIAEDEAERELFTVKKKLALGTKMVATFTNASDGAPIELELRGDFWGGSADIALNGRPVAQISRKLFNARELFTDNQTYFVTVAPGVDLSLIAAICICFDEAKNEKN